MIEAETLHYLCETCFRGRVPAYSCQWRGYPWIDEAVVNIHKKDVPSWFRKLHKVYKNTIWAKETPYYY